MKQVLPVLFTILPLTFSAVQAAAPESTEALKPEAVEESADSSGSEVSQAAEADPAKKAMQAEQQTLALENSLEAEKFKKATNGLRMEVARLKLEKEALAEKLSLEEIKRSLAIKDELMDYKIQKDELERKAELAEKRATLLTNQVKSMQAEAALATLELKSQIELYEVKQRRDSYADSKPQYLDNRPPHPF